MRRFLCPSSDLSLKSLTRGQLGSGCCFLALAMFAHLSAAQIREATNERTVPKPLTTQFVKRQPRLTRPLELKKRPQPKHRQTQRTMVSVEARARGEEGGIRFEAAQVLSGLPRPCVGIRRTADLVNADIEPYSVAEVIEGSKEEGQTIDMSLEMLEIEDLDTGRYHAMVIQHPDDKRSLSGFCRLSWLYIPSVHDKARAYTAAGGRGTDWANYYVGGAVRNLAKAMNEYTAVNTFAGGRITVDDPEAFQIPWVFHFSFIQGYELCDSELQILGRYMVRGGFVFADAHPRPGWSVASSHTRSLIAAVETQGIRSDFQMLPQSHPIYHCYFDFALPPPAADAVHYKDHGPFERPGYLEGLEWDGRLLAILSKKGYYSPWHGDWGTKVDSTRQFQFGVNLIVFALSQEGSITHRLMDSVR